MKATTALQKQIYAEIVSFQKNMDELRRLTKVSRDIRIYRRMIALATFD